MAEDLLEGPEPARRGELETIGDHLRSLVDTLADVGDEPEAGAETATEFKSRASHRARRNREDLRVASGVVDDLADRGARLRAVSVAAEGLADRIFRLAALAEGGVGERDPRQVLATLAISLRQVAMEFESGQRIFRRLSDRQLDALLRLQVQPLKPFLTNLAGHARELAASLGKKVEVRVKAGESQLDRRIVNALREAFLHLVRNSVDHGIESPDERKSSGKMEVGTIQIEAEEEGDRVRIRVIDDGRGIDIDAVVKTATDRKIVTVEEAQTIEIALPLARKPPNFRAAASVSTPSPPRFVRSVAICGWNPRWGRGPRSTLRCRSPGAVTGCWYWGSAHIRWRCRLHRSAPIAASHRRC